MHLPRLLLIILVFLVVPLAGQQGRAPVVFAQDTLFHITTNMGTFTPEQRAEQVERNLQRLAKLPLREFDSLRVVMLEGEAQVVLRDDIINSISVREATASGRSLEALTEERLRVIREALIADFNDSSLRRILVDIALFTLALLFFLLVFWGVNKAFDFFRGGLRGLDDKLILSRNEWLRRFSLITPSMEKKLFLFLLRMTRYTVLIVFLYLYLPFLFSQLNYTRGFGEQLMEYVLQPLRFLYHGITGFLPSFLFIVIIIVASRYLIGGMRYIARQVGSGQVTFTNFYPDWAIPTFNLLRVMVIIFTLVIIFPYLPGAGTDAFQGISVFVGLLLSLGAAGIIGNVISGVILTYMRPFVIGDRVRINDVTGDVIGKSLLVTRIKTVRNEEVTIPNGILMNGGVMNYSSLTAQHGLILHTSLTIGYDVPWPQVHRLMIAAAERTALVDRDPAPFVLQKALNDWYVEYELNAYTHDSHRMARIYSDLHANLQDTFQEAGVEIMSPHYMALRDGNGTTIPGTVAKDRD
ncbi:mechanosensitive ion channel-like protein [Neolewinella xylanilytica]|uniref:Mechanosensitive ion channel-like protein n=1 Tax=Neolewinella xylanilytica TaxID=1514080 RepID=A0A2S6I1Q8_9BACT|nr:mechanosensitive ion channel family protein [Neolewinella xylanilytica]PPK85117.1 mechanosensitive ion channel-like protein [Neolewinella xylanilytica]